MTKTSNETDTLAHLQSLDQCGYDLVYIIEKHYTKPAEADKKELVERFWVLLTEMNRLMRNITKGLDLGSIPELPNKNLLTVGIGNQKYLKKAILPLELFLNEVRYAKRGSQTYPIHTGVRDEKLKEYLDGVDKRKNDEIIKEKLATKIPDGGDNTFAAGIFNGKKRTMPPHFSETDWGKIEFHFITNQEVYIMVGKKDGKQSDYKALGFSNDKSNIPNIAWNFLLELAKNNGETPPLPKPIPDNIKQQKKHIADRLKTIFKNDTDPFYDPAKTQTYKIKIKLTPPEAEREKPEVGKYDTREYLKDMGQEILPEHDEGSYEITE